MSRRSVDRTFPVARGRMTLRRDADARNAWLLEINATRQSFVDLDDPTRLVFAYMRRIGHVVDLVAAEGMPLSVAHLGGGGLTLARYVEATRPGSRQRVFEIDRQLVDHVRRELPLPASARIRIRIIDALDGLRALTDASADLVITDVFDAGRVPAHLLTLELARQVRRVLRPNGVWVTNVVDAGPLDVARQHVANTQERFRHTAAVIENPTLRRGRSGNIVVLASNARLPLADLRTRCAADEHPARLLSGTALQTFRGGYAGRDLAAALAKRRL